MTEPNWDNVINLRIGVSIYPSQDKAIDKVLGDLLERCPAQFILVTDTSGLIVSAKGERGAIDVVALGSLIAGDLAASQEIARITGQYQNYQFVMREGTKVTTLISEAGRYLVLFVQISADVPMGWARILIREASRQLSEIMEQPPDNTENLDLGLDDEKLANLIGDSFDAMWTD
jgi:predicted regulator of Ras-like GTPase activity (Roadblock/LC7/MglB family)